MFVFSFSVPGEINYRFVKTSSKEEAEKLAEKACKGHYFCGGPVCPPVFLEGELLSSNRVKLRDGRIVKDTF